MNERTFRAETGLKPDDVVKSIAFKINNKLTISEIAQNLDHVYESLKEVNRTMRKLNDNGLVSLDLTQIVQDISDTVMDSLDKTWDKLSIAYNIDKAFKEADKKEG
jgi:hypothetical protein